MESILRNLIFEMLECSSLKPAFHRLVLNARLNEKSQYAQSIEILWNLFTEMIDKMDVIHCIIDGFDECQSSEFERASFLSRLVKVFNQTTPDAKLILISQLHLSESEDHSSYWIGFSIEPSSVQEDIEILATTQIESSKVLKTHPEKDNLLKQLVLRSNGMILWTKLMIKELKAGHWNIHNVLEKPPQGLFEMWQSILQRISHSRLGAEKLSRTLQLILAAARPLSHEELALSLAVVQGLRQHEDYDTRGDATAEGRLIVQESSPLLTSMPDNTVQLSHSSLKDYLLFQDAPSVSRYFYFNEQDAHAQMSTVLIKYMSFQSFQAPLSEQLQPKYFLLEYATRWLVYHSMRTGVSTPVAENLVLFFGLVQGWTWLQRLSDAYDISFGHLQLLQSDMASWAQSSCSNDQSVYTISNFLLVLAQNRYESMKSLPNDNLLLLDSMDNLGTTLGYLGRDKETEDLQMQVVEIRKRVLGAEHSDTLKSMQALSLSFLNQGRYKESEKLNLQILELSTRALGAEHLDTLSSMSFLALDFHKQARYKESEKLNMQILEIRTRVLGVEHPATLISMDGLAKNFHKQARYKESEKLNIQLLEIRTKMLGAEHPETLDIMHNLARSLQKQGRYKESEKLNIQILEISMRVLGAEHPSTLASMHNLASDFDRQGRYEESAKLNMQCLEICTRVLGAEHPDTLDTMHNLAADFDSQGWYKESEKLNMQILEISTRVLGAEHPHTLDSMFNLARILDHQSRFKESEKLNMQCIDISTRVLGAEHPHTLDSMHNLATDFDRQGRYEESEKLNMQILETKTRVLGAEHPHTLDSMHNLATDFDRQGRYEESEKLNMQILETKTRVLGAEHPSTLKTMNNLAWDYRDLGRRNEAIELMEKVVDLRSRTIGPDHPDTLGSIFALNEWSGYSNFPAGPIVTALTADQVADRD